MAAGKVLVVAGTHGNECNAPWLLQHWLSEPWAPAASVLPPLALEFGNPAALAAKVRYLERDLNRSFSRELLDDPDQRQLEVLRARELLAVHGPAGSDPCVVAIDLHSTTAAMGSSLVLYGRRPPDLALAAAIQAELGLPIYLHEDDAAQTGFLVEGWPCGLVIEVGPVPQGVITAQVVRQSQLALETALGALERSRRGQLALGSRLTVHVHCGSLDLPRQLEGGPGACLHPLRQHRDWWPIQAGDPLFQTVDGRTIAYEPPAAIGPETVWPVFINEAAYGEKGIALSITRRQHWPIEASWGEALHDLLAVES